MSNINQDSSAVSRRSARSHTRDMVLCALYAALITVGGFIRIQLPGVGASFTAQTFVVLLGAMLLGWRNAAIGCGVYIAIGLLGLPVFTRGGGPMYVLNYEFGYLLGMILSAVVCGVIAKKLHSSWGYIVAALVGAIAVYVVAMPYIYMLTRLVTHTDFDFGGLFAAFMLPFLPLDALKAVIAAVAGWQLSKVLRHII